MHAKFNFINGIIKGSIKGMVSPVVSPLDASTLIILTIFEPPWVCAAIGNILTYIMSSSHFGRRHGAEDMMIFSAHGFPHVSNTDIFL